MVKKPYPRNEDVRRAIVEVLSRSPGIHPSELPQLVIDSLRGKGFFTGHLTVKRVWRLYEEMVREGRIPDILGVVQ